MFSANMLLCSVGFGLEFWNCCLVVPTESRWLGFERPKSDAGHELPSGPGLPDCTALAPHVHIWHSDWFGDLKRLKKGLGPALDYGPALEGQEVKSSPYPQVDKPILLGAKTLKANQPLRALSSGSSGLHKACLIVLMHCNTPSYLISTVLKSEGRHSCSSQIHIWWCCMQNVKAEDMMQ